MWNSETRDVNFILKRLKKDLESIWADCQILRELQIPEVDVVVCSIEEAVEDYLEYSNGFIEAIDKTKKRNSELVEKNNKMVGCIKAQSKELKKAESLIDTLQEAVDLINENAQALSLSRKLKTESLKGKSHPRYRDDVDNDSLIKDYLESVENRESGKKYMTLKELGEKYNMTIQGVKNRLTDLGVYKSVYKK
jgi:hypothetical protein